MDHNFCDGRERGEKRHQYASGLHWVTHKHLNGSPIENIESCSTKILLTFTQNFRLCLLRRALGEHWKSMHYATHRLQYSISKIDTKQEYSTEYSTEYFTKIPNNILSKSRFSCMQIIVNDTLINNWIIFKPWIF